MLKNIFEQGDKVTIMVDGQMWKDRGQLVVGTVDKIERLDRIQAHNLACVWKDALIAQGVPVYHVGHQGRTYMLLGDHLALAA
jgi:hypothetical protein